MTEPCNLAKNLSKSFSAHFVEFTNLKVEMKKALDILAKNQGELSRRLFDLEEKERDRAREDHAREQALDFKNAEGLGEI